LKLPALAAAALSAVAFLGTLLLLKESLPKELRKPLRSADGKSHVQSPIKVLSTRPVLLSIVLTAVIIGVAGAVLQSIYPVWALATHGHDTKWVGIAFGVLAALAVVSQAGLVGILAKRLGERGVAGLGALGFALGLAVMAFLPTPWALWVGLVLAGLGLGLTTPSLNALASFQAAPHERGSVMGAFQSGTSLGRVIGPAISGPLYAAASHSTPFIVATALGFLALLLVLRVPEPTQGARVPRGP
jgi:MFS transporter, DHA1 family, tetracycline resistance protein